MKKHLASLFIVPLISIIIIYAAYKILYPILSYDTFPLQISPLQTIKLLALLNSLLIPLIISRLYKLKILIPISFWVVCTACALFLDTGHYDGNPNSALALDIFPYQLLAMSLTIFWILKEKGASIVYPKEESQ